MDIDGNDIEIEDENDYKLSDIINDKKIKLISFEKEELIKIFLNNKECISKNLSQKQNLYEIRNNLKNEIKNFIFIDLDGCDIEKEDEKDFCLKDILNNQSIYLKTENSIRPNLIPLNSDRSEHPYTNAKKIFDFSKYEEVENEYMENIKLYLYSKKEGQSKYENVYEYFYDEFDINDYKNAYIVLFWGRIGSGKKTSINALFNIIKGIELEDNFRFILIKESDTKMNVNKSKIDGVHLYYVKDYNNKPIILISIEEYGDYMGPIKDEKIIKALSYVFANLIEHINACCFITKATDHKLDILTKYVFSSITNLFSEDFAENFIFLATFANSHTVKEGPTFTKHIAQYLDVLNINNKIEQKYWFSFDSKSLFDDDIDCKLTKYSYEQYSKLYEKIKNLYSKR